MLPSVWVFHLVQYGVCTRKPDGVTTFYRLSGLMQPQYGQLLYGSALRTGTRRYREALLRPPSETTEGERRRGGPELARAQPREGRRNVEPKSSPVSISLRLRRRKWEETSPRREENRENSAPLCVCCWSWSPSTRSRDDPLSSARSTVNVTSEDPLAKA